MSLIDMQQSKAFTEIFTLYPIKPGSLNGLTFGVKDCIEVKDHITSNGHPRWKETHTPAQDHAPCVHKLLSSGATLSGITSSVELTFSIDGDNPLYGTPLNPKAPLRLPGGSSSGSASAVACGFVDFALGTDNTGSIRVPASHTGIWGIRPTSSLISTQGVLPFAPSFDTVGILAKNFDTLTNVMSVYLSQAPPMAPPINGIFLIREAFDLVDREITKALFTFIQKLAKRVLIKEISLNHFVNNSNFISWSRDIIMKIQLPEIIQSLGPWLDTYKPSLTPRIQKNVENALKVTSLERERALDEWKTISHCLHERIDPFTLICIPTTPTIAPLISQLHDLAFMEDYYKRTFALSALSVLGKLPQVCLPLVGLYKAPINLSFLARSKNDAFLLGALATLLY